MRPATLLVAAALVLGGCASAPVEEAPKRAKPLAGFAADPFVPVNLYLNANDQLGGKRAQLAEYGADLLGDSGAFVRVDRGVQRWPITLQVRYRFEENTGAGDSTRRVLGWMTFGLVKVHVTQTHTLVAEVLTEPDSVGVVEVTATVQDTSSAYERGDPLREERVAVEELLERLLGEISQRKLVPRWSEFKPDPKKKPKPEPEGRPT